MNLPLRPAVVPRAAAGAGEQRSDDMGIVDEIERRMKQLERDQEIHCPFCDALDRDEDRDCVSYWGEGKRYRRVCSACDRDFIVVENVTRTYATEKPSIDD
jgi:hypothetical protein